MQLIFSYNEQEDINNSKLLNKITLKGGDSNFLALFFKRFKKLTNKNLKEYIAIFLNYNKINLDDYLEKCRADWQAVEPEFTKRAEKIFGLKLSGKINAFLTTNDRCTYSFQKKSFFISVSCSNPKKIILHELLHFYTIAAFDSLFQKVNDNKKIYDFKEALTILLDLEFMDLMGCSDIGYPDHQLLRARVAKIWQETKDINKVAEIILKN